MKKFVSLLLVLCLCLGVFVGCKEDQPDPVEKTYDVNAAKDYVWAKYKSDAEITPADYTVIGKVIIEDVTYTVEWSVDNAAAASVTAGDGSVTIDVNEKTETEVAYVLTATVKDPDGATATCSFNHIVPAYKEFGFADYIAAAVDDPVVVKGIVTGIMAKSKGNSYNCLYLQDEDGGFYVYSMATDPIADDKVAVGMTVKVTGAKDIYSGTHEIKNGTVEILDETIKTVEAEDFTELFKNAASLKDETLVAKQAKLVTIKGVEIVKSSDSDISSGYYRFKLGNNETYIRISSSVCPLTKEDQATFKEGHTSHTGWIANATGVICVYDGAFYLTPVTADAFEYVSLPDKSDAEKAAFEKDNLSLPEQVVSAGEIAVPTAGSTYNTAAISWKSDKDCVKVENGKLVITMPAETTEAKITATVKCGSETVTRDFTLKLIVSNTFIANALKAASALENKTYSKNQYIVVGTVSAITTAYSEQYKNVSFNLSDGTQEILVYRYGEADAAEIKVGDVLLLKGILQNYNGTLELTSPAVYGTLTSLADAAAAGVAGTGAEGTLVYGQIKAITTAYSAQYGNISVTISDGTNDLALYRLAGGQDLAVGDYILVTGKPSAYNGAAQMAAGATYVKDNEIVEETTPVEPVAFEIVTAPAKDTAYKLALNQLTLGKVLYFAGEMSGNYFATTEDKAAAVEVKLEAVEGGYKLYFMKGDAKTYLDIYEYQAGKAGLRLADAATASAVYTYDTTANTLFTSVAGDTFYMGTYNNYNTISTSKTTYITGDNDAKVDVSQFVLHFVG